MPTVPHVVTADATPAGRAMRIVLSELRREVPYDSCSVQELRGSRLVIIGGVGFAHLDVILGESFEVDNADIPNGEVIHRRRPLIVGDTQQYRAFRRGLHVGAGIRSWLGVPMHRRRQPGRHARPRQSGGGLLHRRPRPDRPCVRVARGVAMASEDGLSSSLSRA